MVSTVTDNLNVPVVIVISSVSRLCIGATVHVENNLRETSKTAQRRNDIADNVKAKRGMPDFTFMLAINYKAQSGEYTTLDNNKNEQCVKRKVRQMLPL